MNAYRPKSGIPDRRLLVGCEALAIVLLVLGCATPRFIPMTRYYLEPSVEVAKAQTTSQALGVRPIEAARPYKQKIAYRDKGFVIGVYETIEWAELPSDVVTRALMDALVATQRYKDVGNAADLAAPDLILTGELRRFDEVHTTNPWTAECEVRLELRAAQGPAAGWSATLSAKAPLTRNETSALPEAMSRAVSDIIQRAAEQIAAR